MIPKVSFHFRGFSDSGQSSWEGKEDGSATDLDAGAWLWLFWKERLKIQNLN